MALAKFYLTVDKDRLRIPLTPNNISVKEGTLSLSFQVIKEGEHKIPRGTQVTGYSWQGLLPGKSMSDLGFVFDWQKPTDIIEKLKSWQKAGKIIDFTVTEASIKDKVFIENVTFTHQGAGNVSYQINLAAYRPLTVTTAPPQPKVTIPTETPPANPPTNPTNPGGNHDYKPPKTDPKNKPPKTPLSVTIPTSGLIKPKLNPVVVTTTPSQLSLRNIMTKNISLVK